MTCVAETVNGPSHHPEVWALKLVVAWLMIGAVVELPALMYVSEVTLGPRTITPVTEATNARKSVAFSDLIYSRAIDKRSSSLSRRSQKRRPKLCRRRRRFHNDTSVSSVISETSRSPNANTYV